MIDAVITSYNQKEMILQAVHSLLKQFVLPSQIIIVDDGSTDPESLSILKQIESNTKIKFLSEYNIRTIKEFWPQEILEFV